ncbi:MAG: hypothetical protein WB770_05755 [Acidimicrobiales bacterium]
MLAPIAFESAAGAQSLLPPPTGTDSCGYPALSSQYADYHANTSTTSSGSYGSGFTFTESTVLRDLEIFGSGASAHLGAFANDENALSLGVNTGSSPISQWQPAATATLATGLPAGAIFVTSLNLSSLPVSITKGETLTLNSGYPVPIALTVSADVAASPTPTTISVDSFDTGVHAYPAGSTVSTVYGSVTNAQLGDSTATDFSLASATGTSGTASRPMYPALYITNLTQSNGTIATPSDPAYYANDWQQGGTPLGFISAVYGTWSTGSVSGGIYSRALPGTRNDWELGPNADTPSGGFAALGDEGYGAEVTWNLSALHLTPGDTYRFQVIEHDGDQTQRPGGGDVGEFCTNLVVPGLSTIQSATAPNGSTSQSGANSTSYVVPVGSTIKDTASVTVLSAATTGNATGSVNFALYDNASCSGSPVFSDTETLTNANPAEATSTSSGPLSKATTYYWQFTYNSTNPNYSSFTASCGQESVATEATTTSLPPAPPAGGPRITAQKTQHPPSGSVVRPGSVVSYGIVLSNSGKTSASGIDVADTIPSGTTYVSASADCHGASGCSVSVSSGSVHWIGITLGGGDSATVTFSVKVNANDVSGEVIPNYALYSNKNTPSCSSPRCKTNTVHIVVKVPLPPAKPVRCATCAHTGMFFAGSGRFVWPIFAIGIGLVALGEIRRRRFRKLRARS